MLPKSSLVATSFATTSGLFVSMLVSSLSHVLQFLDYIKAKAKFMIRQSNSSRLCTALREGILFTYQHIYTHVHITNINCSWIYI